MPDRETPYTIIDHSNSLQQFADQNRGIEWMCFDTEFVGEKRYVTLLCLIQIATEKGLYLIDPLKVVDLDPFLRMLEDPAIEKITHAGENDYRLLNTHFGLIPKNTFDIQVAAGFIGYKYPISFGRILESELKVYLQKGHAVTAWENRPLSPKQLRYALNDVKFLYDLSQQLKRKLAIQRRLDWVIEECSIMEEAEYYYKDPHKEALASNLIKNLRTQEQIFLIRLFDWRNKEAERLNYSKEMILPSKLISHIVRNIPAGLEALSNHRRLPQKMIQKHGAAFVKFYKEPPSQAEKELLEKIPRDDAEDPRQDLITEMLHLLVRYKCLEAGISPNLVMPRNVLKKIKAEPDQADRYLSKGWRKDFLGKELIHWILNRDSLDIDFSNGHFKISFEAPSHQS